jgi:cation transport ATPase
MVRCLHVRHRNTLTIGSLSRLDRDVRGVTAEAVARAVGIDVVEAEVLAEQKAVVVKRLQAEGRRMAMAAITLVQGDLRALVRARRLSRATMRNIRQSLLFAFIDNVLPWRPASCIPPSDSS